MTTTTPAGDTGEVLDALFDSLSDGTRRRILGVLDDTDGAVPDDRLAELLARGSRERAPDGATSAECDDVLVSLRHRHLPKLADAGLIEREPDARTVATADHPAYRDPGVRAVLGVADADSLDALFRALADGRRRAILDVLSHQIGPIHVETLAREVAAGEDVAESAIPGSEVEGTLVGLRHVHLPHLSEAGLIEYDAEAETVEYLGDPRLRAVDALRPRTRLPTEPDRRVVGGGDRDDRRARACRLLRSVTL